MPCLKPNETVEKHPHNPILLCTLLNIKVQPSSSSVCNQKGRTLILSEKLPKSLKAFIPERPPIAIALDSRIAFTDIG